MHELEIKARKKCLNQKAEHVQPSHVRNPGFLIDLIFYRIEYSQFQNFEYIFELKFVGEQKNL